MNHSIKEKQVSCKYCDDPGDSFANINLDIYGVNFANVDVFIRKDNEYDYKLETYIDTPNDEVIAKKLIQINYCPICGRSLRERNGGR